MSMNNTQATMILAGSGRSGTTWLSNILTANPNVQVIFEPFDHRRVPEAAVLPLRPYARPQATYPEWGSFVRRVLQGEIRNEWIERQGRRWWANRLLVKAIRANLLLGWISTHFQPQVVFITRHPCAVVLSRLRLGWDTHLDVFLSQPELVEDYLRPYLDVVDSARTPAQKHAVMWCIENLVPLRQMHDYNWVFCTYEDIYAQPEAEAERILNRLSLRKSWFTRRAIHRVSTVTRADSAIVGKRNPLVEWQHQLADHDSRQVLEILAAFDITLYNDQPMPQLAPQPVPVVAAPLAT